MAIESVRSQGAFKYEAELLDSETLKWNVTRTLRTIDRVIVDETISHGESEIEAIYNAIKKGQWT